MNYPIQTKYRSFFLILCSFGFLASSYSQEIPSLLSDRPGYAYGAGILDSGTVQVELSYEIFSTTTLYPVFNHKEKDLTRSTQLEVRKSWNSKWEWAAGFSFIRNKHIHYSQMENSNKYEYSDTERSQRIDHLYLKFRLPLLPQHQFLPTVTLISDLGVAPYTADVQVFNSTQLVAEKSLHKRLTITGNVAFSTGLLEENDLIYFDSSWALLNIDFAATRKLHLYAERIWQSSVFHSSFENMGLVYLISDSFQIDLSMENWMWSDRHYDWWNLGFGLVYRPQQKQ